MKKITAFALVLILLMSSALASGITDLIDGHNRGCLASGAKQISGDPEIIDGHICYHITDNVNILFSMDGDTFKSFSCVCLDESGVSEFLAQCVASFYNLGGLLAYTYCHDALLTDFLSARAGNEPGNNSSINGLLFRIVKEPYGYTFIIVKV